jgi:hypothetical protein
MLHKCCHFCGQNVISLKKEIITFFDASKEQKKVINIKNSLEE